MKLVIVEASFAADKIDGAIATFKDQSDAVKMMDGCESYRIYSDKQDVVIVQKWHGMEAFEAYRKSDTFAALGAALKPLMQTPPVTSIASIDTL